MARQSTAAQRNLTLTEELERIEQSITLTLQEIDHNFSRAHRIVTQNILPVVERYADHSKDVWEGSKFWKQFFEASANVSLSGYEDPGVEDESVTEEHASTGETTPSTSTYGSPPQADDPSLTPPSGGRPYAGNSFSPSPASETPQPNSKTTKTPRPKRSEPTTAPYSSPYESLKRDIFPSGEEYPTDLDVPSTPRPYATGEAAPKASPSAPPSAAARTAQRTPANDVLLHRVLDKDWRIQATPHSTARLPSRGRSAQATTPKPSTAKKSRYAAGNDDQDLDSSPIFEAPELHAEIFGSPARKGRIPGVSVLTPAKGKDFRRGGRDDVFATKEDHNVRGQGKKDMWDSDSEGEDGATGGLSPPKTMQFHIPQARLMRTPETAREASKRIVEDLLLSAGGNIGEESLDEDSPSIIKRGGLLEEDTF